MEPAVCRRRDGDLPGPVGSPDGLPAALLLSPVGVAPVVANAVYHATGKRVDDLPIAPGKLLDAGGRCTDLFA